MHLDMIYLDAFTPDVPISNIPIQLQVTIPKPNGLIQGPQLKACCINRVVAEAPESFLEITNLLTQHLGHFDDITAKNSLLMTLHWFRHYPTNGLLAAMFGTQRFHGQKMHNIQPSYAVASSEVANTLGMVNNATDMKSMHASMKPCKKLIILLLTLF